MGLDALLGPKVVDPTPLETGLPTVLLLSDLVPGQYQPRTRMDEGALYELAESIKAQGIMQPILVRRLRSGPNDGKYEIIAGERRFRAARLATHWGATLYNIGPHGHINAESGLGDWPQGRALLLNPQ